MVSVDILGVSVNAIDKDGLHAAIENSVKGQRRDVFAYANIHAINIARRDPRFRDVLRKAAIVYCDGEGVRLGARILGVRLPRRIVLTYWIWDLCSFCVQRGFSLFLLGGTEESVGEAVRNMRSRFPGINIAGWHHGYFDKEGKENNYVLGLINNVKPNVLLVGFGMPTQEFWIDSNIQRLRVNAILPAGSLIDYVAGRRRLTPSWMANHGMEWAYRLVQEPGRLWRRYVLGNPLFMLRIMRQVIREGRQR